MKKCLRKYLLFFLLFSMTGFHYVLPSGLIKSANVVGKIAAQAVANQLAGAAQDTGTTKAQGATQVPAASIFLQNQMQSPYFSTTNVALPVGQPSNQVMNDYSKTPSLSINPKALPDDKSDNKQPNLFKKAIASGSLARALLPQNNAGVEPVSSATPYAQGENLAAGLEKIALNSDRTVPIFPKPTRPLPVRPKESPGSDRSIDDRYELLKRETQAKELEFKSQIQLDQVKAVRKKEFNQAIYIKEDIEKLIIAHETIFNEKNQDAKMLKVLSDYNDILNDDAGWNGEPLEVKNELLAIKKELQTIIASHSDAAHQDDNKAFVSASDESNAGVKSVFEEELQEFQAAENGQQASTPLKWGDPDFKPAPPTTPYPGEKNAASQEETALNPDGTVPVVPQPTTPPPVPPKKTVGQSVDVQDLIAELNKNIDLKTHQDQEDLNQAYEIHEAVEAYLDLNTDILKKVQDDPRVTKVMIDYQAIVNDYSKWQDDPSEVQDALLAIKEEFETIIKAANQDDSKPLVSISDEINAGVKSVSEEKFVDAKQEEQTAEDSQQASTQNKDMVVHNASSLAQEVAISAADLPTKQTEDEELSQFVLNPRVYSDKEIMEAFMQSIAFSEQIKQIFMVDYPQVV